MKNLVLITLAFLAAGCGKTGDMPPSSISTPATLSSTNAEILANATVYSALMAIASKVGPTLDITSSTPPDLVAQETGCLDGTADFSLTRDLSNNVTGTGSYSEYDNCVSLVVDGNATVSGILVADEIDNFIYNSADLNFTSGGITYRFVGTVSLIWKPSSGGSSGYVMTLNGTLYDLTLQTIHTLQSFVVDSDISAGVQSVHLTGRVARPDVGYVNISTPATLVFHIPGGTVFSGQFVMVGGTNAATVTYSTGMRSIAITP